MCRPRATVGMYQSHAAVRFPTRLMPRHLVRSLNGRNKSAQGVAFGVLRRNDGLAKGL